MLKAFAYHKPSVKVQLNIAQLRRLFSDLAEVVMLLAPDGREKSLALTKLEECSMWTIKALVCSDPDSEVIDPGDDLAATRDMTDDPMRDHPKVVELLRSIDDRLGVIVSAITDFHDTVKGLLDGITTDLTNIETKLGSINGGALSPADQAALADVTKMVTDLKTRADSDALPPPPSPTPPAAAPTVPGT